MALNEEDGSTGVLPLLSVLATAITIAVFLSPWKTIQEIKNNKSVGSISCVPFISSFMNCLLWISYGYLVQNSTVGLVNVVGLVSSIYYIFVYYSAASRLEKEKLNKTIAFAATILAAVFFYVFVMSDENDVRFNMGIFASVFSIIMFGAPLGQMLTVIRTKSTESMIFPLAIMSELCATAWTLFGYMINDKFVMVPNGIAVVLSAAQLALFVLYPAGKQGYTKPDTKGLDEGLDV